MKAQTYNITLQQGATTTVKTTFRDINGNAIDLSDFSAEMRIRRSVADSTTVLALDSDGPGITLSASDPGNLLIRVSAVQTADLPTSNRDVEDWVYDLKIWQNSDPDYTTTRLMEGRILVSPEVSREDEQD